VSTKPPEVKEPFRVPSPVTTGWSLIKENWPYVAPTGLWLVVALVLSVLLEVSHSPLVPLPGVITLLLVPGAAVMSLLRTRPANTAGRLVLAVCLSMTVIMVVGCLASLLGPRVGLAHPLDPLPQFAIWIVLALLALAVCAINQRDPVAWIFEGVDSTNLLVALGCGVLVLLSLLGVAQLNFSGNSDLAAFATVLDAGVLLAGVVGGWRRTNRWPLNTLLYCVSLALLLSTSLRGGHLYGWDVQQEYGVALGTLHAGIWVVPANRDPYASMLSLTVLPAVLHSLVRLRLLAFFQLVVPAILALLPVAMFSTIRSVPRWITSGRSAPRTSLAFAVVVGLIISSVAFSSELVSITRQAMALTMTGALVMVLFDRTMLVRPSRIIIGVLLVAISFTHYTTSYLLAGIVLCAWGVSWLWSQGWLGTPKTKIEKHRYDVRSRKIINVTIVVVAFAAAFGWNLAITRNSALSAPSSAVTAKGAGIAATTGPTFIPPPQLERLLVSELHRTDSWIVPVAGSGSIHLAAIKAPRSPGLIPSLAGLWNELGFVCEESLWVVLGLSLLYGIFRLGRRRSYEYSADLAGLGVAGLFVGGLLRFSGTLAAYYAPERAAIFTAILLAAPVTLILDDLVTLLYDEHIFRNFRLARVTMGAGFAYLVVLLVVATGLGAILFVGQPPGNLSARDLNAEEFTVSTPELATAVWLRNNVTSGDLVQSDLYGRLVLLSEPANYGVVAEIVPPEVNYDAYIYLSTVNLADHTSQADADNGQYLAMYRTNVQFFNRNFYVVYSTGATRVYH
jgi:uncharacterized membrane protein